jgi:hypothetical protein
MKKKLIRFDWAIKNLFKKNRDLDILQDFLSDLLGREITTIKLCDTDGLRDTATDKSNRVDVHVTIENGEEVIIEVQSHSEKDYFSRILYGTAKAITTHVQEGDPYIQVPKVISISICYCKVGEGKDYLYKGTTSFIGQHYGDTLNLYPGEKEMYKSKAETVTEIYPVYYIIKIDMFKEIINNLVDEWIFFFKTEEIKVDFHSEGIKKAAKRLDYLKLPKAEQLEYDIFVDNLRLEKSLARSREIDIDVAKKEGREEGIEEGISIGEERGKIDIAKKMLEQRADINFIQTCTSLSLEYIKSLSKKNIKK